MNSCNTVKPPCPDCNGEVVFGKREGAPYIPSDFIVCQNCKRLFGLIEWGLIQKDVFAKILKEYNFSETEIEIIWHSYPRDKFGFFHGFNEIKVREDIAREIEKIKHYCKQKSEIPDGNIPC